MPFDCAFQRMSNRIDRRRRRRNIHEHFIFAFSQRTRDGIELSTLKGPIYLSLLRM